MVKRKEVDVDEDLIKSMMTGDIPRIDRNPVKKEKIPDGETVETPDIGEPLENRPEKEAVQPKPKRRREPEDYKSMFLRVNVGAKRQTYINADLYGKISKILGIIARDISVPNFIDNVLERHLKEYRDEINEIYRNNADLPL